MGYSAVLTTGIYCRPDCGGRPLPKNVVPYDVAAAAEAHGFRGVHALPALPRRRADAVGSTRARVSGRPADPRGRTRRWKRSRGWASASVYLTSTPSPVVRYASRRDPGPAGPVAARPLRAATARRHGSHDHRHRVRVGVRERAAAEPHLPWTCSTQRLASCEPVVGVSDRLAADGGLLLPTPVPSPARVARDARVVRGTVDRGSPRQATATSIDARSSSTAILVCSRSGQEVPTISCCKRIFRIGKDSSTSSKRTRRIFNLDLDVTTPFAHLARDPSIGALGAGPDPACRPPGCWDPFEMGVRASSASRSACAPRPRS